MISQAARPGPTSRGSRCVPPPPGSRPRRTSGKPTTVGMGDPDVAGKRELEPAAEAVAVDRRDDRDRAGLDQVRGRLDPAGGSSVGRVAEARDVHAGRERALALAAQDDDTGLRLEIAELARRRVATIAVDRVHRGVVEPDGLDQAEDFTTGGGCVALERDQKAPSRFELL